MKTLVIPDSHERLSAVEQALKVPHDHVVLLGDWFDTFKPWDEDRIYQVCAFINREIDNPNYEFLIGNHDVHYATANADKYACSGFNPSSRMIIRSMIKPETWAKFKVMTKVGAYTLSHAGFNEATLPYAKPEICESDMARMLQGEYTALFGAGHARGGRQAHGGPTWLDWNYEFYHMADFPQIVGHTAEPKPRVKGLPGELRSYCIDTHSQHYIVLEDDVVTVKKLYGGDVVEL